MAKLDDLLVRFGVDHLASTLREARIDLDVLVHIDEQDLKELRIPLGDRRRLQLLISELKLTPEEANRRDGVFAARFSTIGIEDQNGGTELRQISVVFADLVDSTRLSQRLDVEIYQSMLGRFQTVCSEAVESFEGHRLSHVGDGLLAVFGVPRAGENDARRAVNAAMTIAHRVAEIETGLDHGLVARLGVATGIVITSALSREQKGPLGAVTGTVLNLAARLQSMAEPGCVLIDETTSRLIGNDFDMRPLGAQQIRGFSENQSVWQVAARKAAPIADGDPRPDDNAPMVAREEELEFLRLRWQSAQTRGGILMLTGDAGIGKTHLVNAFVRSGEMRRNQVIRLECHEAATLRPLHPLIRLLERLSGIDASCGDAERRDRMRRWAEAELGAPDTLIDGLVEIVSPGSGARFLNEGLRAQDRRARLFEMLVRLIERLCADAPQLFVIEDVHWIDPTTDEFMRHLAERIAEIPAMVLCTHRQDYRSTLLGEPHVATLSLPRLGEAEAMRLVGGIAGAGRLPPARMREIVARSDGVPLFIEEMTKSIVETELPEAATPSESGLPVTLHGFLLARLDRVPSALRLAPVGAAIGRSFPKRLACSVAGMAPEEGAAILDDLLDSGLLSRMGEGEGAIYAFKHALVQDAAYETMPRSRRLRVHLDIAEYFERYEPGFVERRPEELARHYLCAEDYLRASRYYREAADAAQRAAANEEAIAYIHKALEANAKTPEGPERADREIALREMLYVPFEVTSWGSHRIADNLTRLGELHRQRGNGEKLLIVMHGKASSDIIFGRVKAAADAANEILNLDGDQSDIAAALGLRVRGFTHFLDGAFEAATTDFEHVAERCSDIDPERLALYYHADSILIARSMITWTHALNGDRQGFEQAFRTARELAEQAEDKWNAVYSFTILGSACQSIGEVEMLLAQTGRALPIAEELGSIYWAGWAGIVHGWGTAANGAVSTGRAGIEQSTELYASTGSTQSLPYAKLLLAEALEMEGHRSDACALAHELTHARHPPEIRYIDAALGRLKARLDCD